jgi:hypothetical protein
MEGTLTLLRQLFLLNGSSVVWREVGVAEMRVIAANYSLSLK